MGWVVSIIMSLAQICVKLQMYSVFHLEIYFVNDIGQPQPRDTILVITFNICR
jgi:hypothetical protein